LGAEVVVVVEMGSETYGKRPAARVWAITRRTQRAHRRQADRQQRDRRRHADRQQRTDRADRASRRADRPTNPWSGGWLEVVPVLVEVEVAVPA
jgi:hypothetical protein